MTTDDVEHTPAETSLTRKPRTRSIVSWLALLAILIAVAAWFQLVHQQKKSRNNYSQLQNSFSQTQSSTAELSTEVSHLQQQLQSQNEVLTNLAGAFNRSQSAQFERTIDNHLLAADQYLVQANLSLHFNHNIHDAIVLLQAADARLSHMTDPSITTLRSQIATTLVTLRAIAQPDLVGILSQIAAMQDQVKNLPLFALPTKTAQFKAPTPSVDNENWRSKSWRLSLETLKSLVIIRHRDQAITPLLAPMQEQFLRQNLQWMLQQASWAVLQQNQAVYSFSLNQTQTWLQRYFADNAQATQALNDQLKALSAVNIAPQTPDLTPLLQSLHNLQAKYMDNAATLEPHKTPVAVNAPASVSPAKAVNHSAGEVL